MDAQSDNHRSFGLITAENLGKVDLPSPRDPEQSIPFQLDRYVWCPPDRYSEHVPDGFSLSLDCYSDESGVRRFLPADNDWWLQIGQAFTAGLSIRSELDGLDGGARNYYRLIWFVFQWLRRRREHLQRNYHYARDLYIRSPGRLSDRERSILPSDVGLNSGAEKGSTWQIGDLTDVGRKAARDAGHGRLTSRVSIRFGLFEAAKKNPLYATDEQVQDLVRDVLYDLDTDRDPPSPTVVEDVTKRLFRLVIDFDDQKRVRSFDEWLSGPSSNLPKSLAKRNRKYNEAELDNLVVRDALLSLGWNSYQFVANCVNSVMRTIENCIDDLDDQERHLFEHLHLTQPYYGGLPLALLVERAEFVRNAVLAIWDDPDDREAIAVFHRILHYYRTMTRERIRADRSSKQRSTVRNKDGKVANHLEIKNDLDGTREKHDVDNEMTGLGDSSTGVGVDNVGVSRSIFEFFNDLAEFLRERHSITCGQGCMQWQARVVEDQCVDGNVVLEYRCQCGVTRLLSISEDDFSQLRREFFGDDK